MTNDINTICILESHDIISYQPMKNKVGIAMSKTIETLQVHIYCSIKPTTVEKQNVYIS